MADYRTRLADRPVMARTAPGEVKSLLPPSPGGGYTMAFFRRFLATAPTRGGAMSIVLSQPTFATRGEPLPTALVERASSSSANPVFGHDFLVQIDPKAGFFRHRNVAVNNWKSLSGQ